MSYPHKFSVAPMMDWTDRHCRYFHRLLSSKAQLYTEMITDQAILHGDKSRLLDYSAEEHPIAIQLGGSDPSSMAQAAKVVNEWGYDEININVGCPSDRVQSGRFGACLMQTPEIVAACVDAMGAVVDVPVTVKSRIGVDDMEEFDELVNFIDTVSAAGCDTFIIHARKAWLQGLSPKENRSVPPLNYDWVYQIKSLYPQFNIGINGGIMDVNSARTHLLQVDSVMLGRAAYHQPYLLSEVDEKIYQQKTDPLSREQVLWAFIDYMKAQMAQSVPVRAMTRHLLGLYHGQPNAKVFRRLLSGKVVGLAQLYEWLDFQEQQANGES